MNPFLYQKTSHKNIKVSPTTKKVNHQWAIESQLSGQVGRDTGDGREEGDSLNVAIKGQCGLSKEKALRLKSKNDNQSFFASRIEELQAKPSRHNQKNKKIIIQTIRQADYDDQEAQEYINQTEMKYIKPEPFTDENLNQVNTYNEEVLTKFEAINNNVSILRNMSRLELRDLRNAAKLSSFHKKRPQKDEEMMIQLIDDQLQFNEEDKSEVLEQKKYLTQTLKDNWQWYAGGVGLTVMAGSTFNEFFKAQSLWGCIISGIVVIGIISASIYMTRNCSLTKERTEGFLKQKQDK